MMMMLLLSLVAVANGLVLTMRPAVAPARSAVSMVADDACELVRRPTLAAKSLPLYFSNTPLRNSRPSLASTAAAPSPLLLCSFHTLTRAPALHVFLLSQTKLEGYASSSFGRHYRMEGWVCPEVAVETFEANEHECMQVMHAGEMVWACTDTSPIEAGVSTGVTIDEALNDSLFEKLKTALPNLKLFKGLRSAEM